VLAADNDHWLMESARLINMPPDPVGKHLGIKMRAVLYVLLYPMSLPVAALLGELPLFSTVNLLPSAADLRWLRRHLCRPSNCRHLRSASVRGNRSGTSSSNSSGEKGSVVRRVFFCVLNVITFIWLIAISTTIYTSTQAAASCDIWRFTGTAEDRDTCQQRLAFSEAILLQLGAVTAIVLLRRFQQVRSTFSPSY
jgi:hypothetical protein